MATELEKTVAFVQQVIQEKNPDFDLSPSSPLYDLLVSVPANTTLQGSLSLRDEIIQDRSILNTSMSEEKYDEIAANFKKTRIPGFTTIVTCRLFFSQPHDIKITNVDIFDAGTGITYSPRTSVNYSAADFTLQTNQNLYTLDIDLESNTVGQDTVLGIDTVLSTGISNPDFIEAIVVGIKQIGENAESNDELLIRIQKTAGVELPINIRGYSNITSEKFPNEITHIYSAGFSEPEQRRDVITSEIPRFFARLAFSEPQVLNIDSSLLEFKFKTDDQFFYFPVNTVSVGLDDWTQQGGTWVTQVEVDLNFSAVTNFSKMVEGFTAFKYLNCNYLTLNYPNYLGAFSSLESLDTSVSIRVGGRVDLYIKGGLERRVVDVFVPLNSRGIVEIPEELRPVLKIHSASRANPLPGIDTDFSLFSIRVSDPHNRFSALDSSQFYISPEEAGTTVSLDITCMPTVSSLQRYVSLPGVTNSADSLLIKSLIPCFMNLALVVSGNKQTEGRIRAVVALYFINLSPGMPIKVDEILQTIKNDVGNIVIFSDSLVITGWQCLPNGEEQFIIGKDVIYPEEFPSLGVSRKNVQFILDKMEITYV